MENKKENPVIVMEEVCKSFGPKVVLDHFSTKLYKGENVVVLGKSGSGKSVLIKCIIGLLRPESGKITVLNEEVADLDRDGLDRMRVKVGFLFQSNALYDSMTVRENLEFPLRRHWKKTPKEEVDHAVMEALENVGLADTVDKMPAELSGGMRKRIALARTLILKPEIILYDEPTTGLDPITSKEIIGLMLDIQRKYNTSSIVISHDMNCVKMVANRIVMLINGKCYQEGTYTSLMNSDDKNVKQFFE